MSNLRKQLSVAAACCFAAGALASAASAETLNFESPTYNLGTLAGQDGWRPNFTPAEHPGGYVTADAANFVAVVNTTPIDGAQSFRYSNPGAFAFHDHSRNLFGTVVTDGIPGATNLTAGVTIRADSPTLEIGFYLGESTPPPETWPHGTNRNPGVLLGASPIAFRLLNGNIERLGFPGVPFVVFWEAIDTYSTGDEIEFRFEADLDSYNEFTPELKTYDLLVKNVTRGDPSFMTLVDDFEAPFGFSNNNIDGTGNNNAYDVGVGLILRQGEATFDDIFVTLNNEVEVGQPGDYNGDGFVDAADYVVWRKGLSPDNTPAGYDLWRANFGEPGAGAASLSTGQTVPEPTGAILCALAVAALTVWRLPKHRSQSRFL